QVSSYAAKEQCRGRNEWAFWDATRVVSIALSKPGQNDGTINEFPFFTFLYGDLHAHMIALPLALAALGLMIALIRTKNRAQRTTDRGALFSVLCSLFFLSLVVGALRATNTWDFPTYLGLSVGALALAAWKSYRGGAHLTGVVVRWLLASIALVL